MKRLLVLSLLIGGLPACSQSPSQPETVDATPEVSRSAPPGEALVYVLRDERFAAGRMLSVGLGDREDVSLPARSTHLWEVPAGEYVVRVGGEPNDELTLQLESGERAFIRASVAVTEGRLGGRLNRLPADRGKEAVTRTRMVARD